MLFIYLVWIIVLVRVSSITQVERLGILPLLPVDAESIQRFTLRQVRAGGFFGDAFHEMEEVPFCFSFADLILTEWWILIKGCFCIC